MTRKQLIFLVVLLVLVGGILWKVQQGRDAARSSGDSGSGKLLLGADFPLNDVAEIDIKHETNELALVKKSEQDIWRVKQRDEYPANFSNISDFLVKLKELKIVQVEEIGPSQLARLELAGPGQGSNSAVVLELKDKTGKAIRTLWLGKKHSRKMSQQQAMQFGGEGFPDGRYVMLPSDAKNALLVTDPMTQVEPKPADWLNKDFFKVERPRTISLAFPEATNSWKISRDTEAGDWKLVDAKPDEKLDSTKASNVYNPFGQPGMDDVVPKSAKPEDYGLDKPTVLTVETFDDFVYTIKIGKKNGESYPISMAFTANLPKERPPAKDEKPEDKALADKAWTERQKQLEEKLKQTKTYEGWTFLVTGWNVDVFLKVRGDLLAAKVEAPKAEATPPVGTPTPVPDLNPPK